MYIVMKSLIGVPTRNAWRIPFGGVRGLAETTVRNPTQLADHLRSEGRVVVRLADDVARGVHVPPCAEHRDGECAGDLHQHPQHLLVPVPHPVPLQHHRCARDRVRHRVRARHRARRRALDPQPRRDRGGGVLGGRGLRVGPAAVHALEPGELVGRPPGRPGRSRHHRRHPRRRGDLGPLPHRAARRLPRRGVPVPEPVPDRALRTRHLARGHP